jgi:diguanylate cyclase (GGDEF)-like protein
VTEGRSGDRAAPLPTSQRSWLVAGGTARQRMLDMDRRLRPIRLRTFLVAAVALLAAGPWTGWWTLLPLLIAAAVFRLADTRTDRASRPEYWMFGAWAAVEAIIAASVAMTGDSAISLLVLLAIPVATLSARFSMRGVLAGGAIAVALMIAVALGTDAGGVAVNPPLLFAPLAVVVAGAVLSTPLMSSDIEHRDKAILDPLTNLLNRRSLDARAKEVEHQSALTREPVGVVYLDLDKFKSVNDSLGHEGGDAVLVDVAYQLRKGLRAYDLIYRLGGDEFLVLVPGADLAHARRVGQDARAIISRASVGPGVTVTASCGVSASVEGDPFDFATVSAHADRALYQAKRSDGFACQEGAYVERFGAMAT